MRALDHDAGLVAVQIIGIGHQRHHVGGAVAVVHVVQIALGIHKRFQIAVAIDLRAQDRGAGHLDRPGVGRGALRGIGAVQRIIDPAGRGHRQRDVQHVAGVVKPALVRIHRQRRAAQIGRPLVGRAGRDGGKESQAVLALDAAVGDVLVLHRHEQPIEHDAGGIGQRDGIAAVGGQPEPGLQPGLGGLPRSVGEYAQISPGLDHRALGELPFARAAGVVGQAEAGQVHRFGGAVVQFDPVIGFIRRRQHLGDVHAAGVQSAHGFARRVGALGRVGIARRGRKLVRPAGLQQRIRLVRRQNRQPHAGRGDAVGIGQIDLLALVGKPEIRVQVLRVAGAVFPGAVHGDAAARRQRDRREAPARQPLLGIGQRPALQVHRFAGDIADLHIIGIIAVFIGEIGGVIAHGLADLQRAGMNLHVPRRDFGAGEPAGLVGRAGRGKIADLPFPCGVAAVDLVAGERGHVHRVRAGAAPIQERDPPAGGRQPERRVPQAVPRALAAVGEYQRIFPRLQRAAGEHEGVGGVGLPHQRPALQVDGLAGGVLQLDPVRQAAVFGDEGGGVGGHDFAETQSAALGVRGRDPPAVRQRLGDVSQRQGQQTDHGDQRRQHAQRPAAAPPAVLRILLWRLLGHK